jgi:polar amino acid transport system permease protein
MTTPSTTDRPGKIDARPVRHPGRWVAIAVILVIVAMMVSSAVTNPRWDWSFALEVMRQNPVLEGLVKGTLLGTVGSMLIGVGLGVVMAVMRLSANPVLRGVSFVYTWFFRSVPRYVLLATMGSLGYLYPVLDLGVPFGKSAGLTFAQVDINALSNMLAFGILGLGLSEAAYMAEIARAGILSVDQGQTEAAQALGMSPGKTTWRIVLPQAMRVIVPPTGNETIAMVKDTSLLLAMSITTELFFQTQAIGTRTLKIMPAYVAAVLWYLVVCSVLMVGQARLEKYYGRGFGAMPKKAQQKLTEIGADH